MRHICLCLTLLFVTGCSPYLGAQSAHQPVGTAYVSDPGLAAALAEPTPATARVTDQDREESQGGDPFGFAPEEAPGDVSPFE